MKLSIWSLSPDIPLAFWTWPTKSEGQSSLSGGKTEKKKELSNNPMKMRKTKDLSQMNWDKGLKEEGKKHKI